MTTKCSFVALLGAPNAGKSTLTNNFVGSKVSIVTPKVQTTRSRVIGVMCEGETQIVLVDTPGVFTPEKRLQRAMVDAAWQGVNDADSILVIVDVTRAKSQDNLNIFEKLTKITKPKILVLNKIDLIKKEKLFEIALYLQDKITFEKAFMISALNSSGVEDLKNYILQKAKEGPWHYPEGQLSNLTDRLFAAEITREKLFLNLHDEIPYGLTVETESWEEFDNGSIKINQMITIEREGHKSIILGAKGSMIKRISQEARKELEIHYDTKIHLYLFVRVRENWQNNPDHYKEMGIDFTK
jgi:GTP-binding protein Era